MTRCHDTATGEERKGYENLWLRVVGSEELLKIQMTELNKYRKALQLVMFIITLIVVQLHENTPASVYLLCI